MCRLQWLWHTGLVPWGTCMWDLPGPGVKPVSLALQSGFLTTGPSKKPHKSFYYIPPILTLLEFLSWMDVEFCQMLFCICWDDCVFVFYVVCFCLLCGVSHWLIYLYWTILKNLQWISLGFGLFFLCVVWFGLLIFCWGFLHLCSSKTLACNCICLVLVSG